MGLIDDVFSKIEDDMMRQMKGVIEEAGINQQRPSVTSLPFRPVPRERAEALRGAKTGLFGGGTKKKFIAAIEEGRTTYAEVLVLARFYRIVERSEVPGNNLHMYFYKMADLSGRVIREDAPMPGEKYDFAFAHNGGDSDSETECADVVDPGAYRHMFLLHYYLKDDQYYVLLTRELFEDMSPLLKYAGDRFHFVEDGVGYYW